MSKTLLQRSVHCDTDTCIHIYNHYWFIEEPFILRRLWWCRTHVYRFFIPHTCPCHPLLGKNNCSSMAVLQKTHMASIFLAVTVFIMHMSEESVWMVVSPLHQRSPALFPQSAHGWTAAPLPCSDLWTSLGPDLPEPSGTPRKWWPEMTLL